MKKFLSLVVAFFMVFSMVVPAYAVDSTLYRDTALDVALSYFRDSGYLDTSTSDIYGAYDDVTGTACYDYLISRQSEEYDTGLSGLDCKYFAKYTLYVINGSYRWPNSTSEFLSFSKIRDGYDSYAKWSGGGFSFYVYSLDGENWEIYLPSIWGVGSTQIVMLENIVVSSCDIVREDGSLFFQRPLTFPEKVEEMWTQEIPTLTTQIQEYLTFLVPFGIGLLASLMALVVLRKVFSTFRV